MSNKVEFMTDFDTADFTARYQIEFFEYWKKIKSSRTMPSRSDISPHDFVSILPHIIMFDYLPDENDFMVRLIGTKSASLLGEPKGRRLSDLKEHVSSLERLRWCVENKKPYYVIDTMGKKKNKHIKSSALVMPLSKNDQDVNMVIMVCNFWLI
ncbi:MAG: PAS domain-containing protein [Kordiimonadaceae bacterium]|jgi:hypothetical protein|nr:PAS domain-containing protein [Kordiimonadaceae bacterium]